MTDTSWTREGQLPAHTRHKEKPMPDEKGDHGTGAYDG
jgi:hypothetical protein